MKKNRDLFTESIADAKSVKEMAISNAKLALEEAFTPHLKSMMSAKIEEMEKEEEEISETSEVDETKQEEDENEMYEETSKDKEVDLDELLAELNEEEEESVEEELNENEDLANEAKKDEVEKEEEVDLENISEKELKNLIKDVIEDMKEEGELEGGSGDHDNKDEDEDVSIDEILKNLNEDDKIEGTLNKKAIDKADDEYYEKSDGKHVKGKDTYHLKEAVKTIKKLKEELNEINLLNCKLLYTNKIFKAKNLSESVKIKVLNSFDKAKNVQETKIVYQTLLEGLKNVKQPIKENKSFASSIISKEIGGNKKQILENNDAVVSRFRVLAGLKKI